MVLVFCVDLLRKGGGVGVVVIKVLGVVVAAGLLQLWGRTTIVLFMSE